MRFLSLALVALAPVLCGCRNCNQVNNPVSKDYPCGTRAHACSITPLECCWNGEICGGQPGCPPDMCCYVGESPAGSEMPQDASPKPLTSPSAKPAASALPDASQTKMYPKWKP
jgi:hypothetical protein